MSQHAFRSVVFVLGFVSLINSLTSGKNTLGLNTPRRSASPFVINSLTHSLESVYRSVHQQSTS